MKYLIILISVFCVVQYSSAEPLLGELLGGAVDEVGGVVQKIATKLVGEAIKIVTPAATFCMGSHPLTPDEYRRFSTIQLQETRNGNCFMSCMMKKLSIMSSDNEATRKGFLTIVLTLYPDATSKDKFADELFKSCKYLTNTDECEAARLLGECIVKIANIQARNYSKGVLRIF